MGAGLAMQTYSAIQGAHTQHQIGQTNQDIAKQEYEIEAQRHQQMVLNSRRQQTENIRNVQLARSMALNSATGQGAQQGSGLAGGLSQANSQGGYNALGINQNLMIGDNIFAANKNISQDKQQLASLGSDMATTQAISSFGGNLMKVGSSFGGNPFMSGGSGGQPQGPLSYGQLHSTGSSF